MDQTRILDQIIDRSRRDEEVQRENVGKPRQITTADMNNLTNLRLACLRAGTGVRTRNGDKTANSILLQLSRENLQSCRLASTKLDQIVPLTVDFPARHIGPRKHDARY